MPKCSRDYQQISIYKDVNFRLGDWHWQLKHRIRTKEELAQIIKLTPKRKKGIDKARGSLAMAITPYWASQIDAEDPNCPIRRQSVPVNGDEFCLPMKWLILVPKTGFSCAAFGAPLSRQGTAFSYRSLRDVLPPLYSSAFGG